MIESQSDKVLIIAEAGVNHDGDLNQALKLVDVAAEAGADIVKFQSFHASSLATSEAELAQYQRTGGLSEKNGGAGDQLALLERLQLSRDDHLALMRHCAEKGIEFFSTGFDFGSLQLLADLGVRRFKIPSGEITNLPLMRRIASFGEEVIVSTGMAELSEVGAAIESLEIAGLPKEKITLLHCTTEYPAPIHDVNLRAMDAMASSFDVRVGYSDHTEGVEVAIAAVALGAKVIEKHFTLDKNLPGPDHRASLEPVDLKLMIDAIRKIETALGSDQKMCTSSEKKNVALVRKSIVAATPIEEGEAFTEENLTVKRPGTGLSPMLWDRVLGSRASRSFQIDERITL